MPALLPISIPGWEPLKDLLFELLLWIHTTSGLSWALSIIALTALVRIAILPVTAKQTRSMLAMQRLQPYVKQLQQKYKDDRQELNAKLIEFYRDNRVNPLASCFPLLLQIPIFIALFYVLKDFDKHLPKGVSNDFSFLFGFVENIRTDIIDAGFPGWFLLVFYVASQVFASRVMMTTPDPRQRMLFMILPIAFVPFIINFPIGLMLYWITTNLWTLGQHLVVVRLTDTSREVVLPEDSKGRKRTVTPKGDKRRRDDDGVPAGGKANAGTRSGTARKNKRRR